MLQQKFFSVCYCAIVLLGLNACSSAVFPEVIEDDGLSESILKEDNTLTSDTQNAMYEGEDDEVFADVVPDVKTVEVKNEELP